MNEKQQKILSLRVGEVLYYIWDPLGVSDMPEARDEYDSYIPEIVEALLNNENEEKIAKRLYDIEVTWMEVAGNLENCKSASSLLDEWLIWIRDKGL